MTFLDSLYSVILSIGKANLIVVAIILISIIVEKITGLGLFLVQYRKWSKSPRNAEINANGDIGTYIIIMIRVVIYDIYRENLEFGFLTIFFALTFIYILSKISYHYNIKHQNIDPNKVDDDYT